MERGRRLIRVRKITTPCSGMVSLVTGGFVFYRVSVWSFN